MGYSYFNFVLSGIIGTLLAVVGIIGNALCLVILSRKVMRSPTNCILQGLAFFDTFVLICALIKDGLNSLASNSVSLLYYKQQIYPKLFLVLYPLKLIALTGSTWCTVAVTIERYIAVCHPVRSRTLSTCRRAQLCNVFVFIFSVCLNLPRFWDFEVIEKFDPETNVTVIRVRKDLMDNKLYFRIYNVWIGLLTRFIVPFLILAVLNGAICRAIRIANKNRQNLNCPVRNEVRLTLMLLCVVMVFFVCNVFTFLLKVCQFFNQHDRYLEVFAYLLVTLNSSVNFVIYCLFSRTFRRLFCKVFGECSPTWFRKKVFGDDTTEPPRQIADKSLPQSTPCETETDSAGNRN